MLRCEALMLVVMLCCSFLMALDATTPTPKPRPTGHCNLNGLILTDKQIDPATRGNCEPNTCVCDVEGTCVMRKSAATVSFIAMHQTVMTDGTVKSQKVNMSCKCPEPIKKDAKVGETLLTCVMSANAKSSATEPKCLDINGTLVPQNEHVTIKNSFNEITRCKCTGDGEYQDCEPVVTPGCLGSDGKRVSIGDRYPRIEEVDDKVYHLDCKCVHYDIPTPCNRINR